MNGAWLGDSRAINNNNFAARSEVRTIRNRFFFVRSPLVVGVGDNGPAGVYVRARAKSASTIFFALSKSQITKLDPIKMAEATFTVL